MTISRSNLEKVIFHDYLVDYSMEMGFKEATIKTKTGSLKRFIRWMGNKPFNAESCREWVRWLTKVKKYKPESIKHEIRVIRSTIRFLHKRNFIKKDFALEIPSPKVPEKRIEIVPAKVAEQIIIEGTKFTDGDNRRSRKIKKEHRLALRFVLRTGVRNRELRDLKGSDIDFEEKVVFVNGKNGKIEPIVLPEDLKKVLIVRKNNKRLFEVRPERLNKYLKKGCERLSIDKKIRVHSLRHIFCTSLGKNGVPIQYVKRMMRHSSIEITDKVYSHYNIEDLRLALNSKHPLIAESLKPLEYFNVIENSVVSTGVNEDKRFRTLVSRNQKELKIFVRYVK